MVDWNRRKYSKEEFTEAWNSSRSIAECLRRLSLNIYGSAYSGAKAAAEDLGLSNAHMTGQGWNTGESGGFIPKPARPLDRVLVYGKRENNDKLKRRLFREGIKDYVCESCGLTKWMGQEIPLALDHIDGDRLNNRLNNLRVLCYNCHGQTETFCRRK